MPARRQTFGAASWPTSRTSSGTSTQPAATAPSASPSGSATSRSAKGRLGVPPGPACVNLAPQLWGACDHVVPAGRSAPRCAAGAPNTLHTVRCALPLPLGAAPCLAMLRYAVPAVLPAGGHGARLAVCDPGQGAHRATPGSLSPDAAPPGERSTWLLNIKPCRQQRLGLPSPRLHLAQPDSHPMLHVFTLTCFPACLQACLPAHCAHPPACPLRLPALLQVFAGRHLVLETSQVMADIPYGDHFRWAGRHAGRRSVA